MKDFCPDLFLLGNWKGVSAFVFLHHSLRPDTVLAVWNIGLNLVFYVLHDPSRWMGL